MGNFLVSTPATLSEAITAATGVIGTVITWTVDTVMANPLLATFFVVGLIGLGIGVLSRLKRV